MIGTGLAATVLVTCVAFTYFFCVRPMKRGQCVMASRAAADARVERKAEIAKLREEIQVLQHQRVPQGANTGPGATTPISCVENNAPRTSPETGVRGGSGSTPPSSPQRPRERFEHASPT